jgi:hypothetical protein
VVGEEDVKSSNEIKQLRKSEGIYAPLKHKGYFERCPYLLQRAALIAGAIIALAAIAVWSVFTPDPPRNCNYSDSLKSCTWTARLEAKPW